MRAVPAAAALCAALGCGTAELVVPAPLTVLDTSPGQGSLVPAGSSGLVVLFSEPVDQASLPGGVALEQTTPAGSPLEVLPLELAGLAAEDQSASYRSPPYGAGKFFRLTVRADTVRAASGATLVADFVRRFSTAPP